MSRYLIVIETTPSGFSAYSPDLPGCVSTGQTRDAVQHQMREAIEFQLDGLRQDGAPILPPSSTASYIEVAA